MQSGLWSDRGDDNRTRVTLSNAMPYNELLDQAGILQVQQRPDQQQRVVEALIAAVNQ